ncbi:MAG TPA: oxalurate catabolism protein HpxZ [Xanthobacteraceae bacterium]
MRTNIPEVVAEVTAEFMRYERALGSNDVDTIDTLFWNDPRTLRYGPQGTMLGHAQISAFRHGRKIDGIKRTLRNTVITTFGRDFATANTESVRHGTGMVSRQSQTWVRLPEGWRIVSAHVSEEAAQPAK